MFDTHVRRSKKRARARRVGGFTLAEIMVAIAVFAVIVAIAMTLYQQLQKNFKQGENATTQQQNTRIAFDRMMSDLRMAGFNYNPDGVTRPDEQIEGMWANAVTVRGDYDYETPDANTPEPSLAGGAFTVVSTGNDEIVTYALGKPSNAGGTTIQFQADVMAVPRDGTLQTVAINNVYLDMNSPPYTLYRITLKPGGTALASMPDKVPIADNIRRMDITYFDGAGTQIATMAQGMDDPNSVALRKKIAKINVKIVGMTQDPDLAYLDPADTNPKSQHFRKFDLSSDVTPRNLGFVGMQDVDLDKPTTPTGLAVCPGHCKGLYATWTANPSQQGVIKYTVTSGPTMTSQTGPQDAFNTNYFVGNLTMSSSYVLAVTAVDAAGNQSDPAAFSSPTTVSDSTVPDWNTPVAATSVAGGNAVKSQINLAWAKPTRNVTNLACDTSPFPIRDLAGYRLFRGATSGFDPNVPAQVQITRDPNTINAGAAGFSDPPDPNVPSVVNCRTYFYKAVAEDYCGVRSNPPMAASGSSTSNVKPSIPTSPTALDMGNSTTFLTWSPVTTDVTPSKILIDKYKVFRTAIATGADPNLATYSLVYDGLVGSVASPTYTDPNVPNIPGSQRYWYRISAHDDCVNESDQSIPALVSRCSLGGSIQINVNPGGSTVSGIQTITVTVTGGVSPVSGELIITDQSNGANVLNQTSASYPYVYTWNSAVAPTIGGHSYTITAAVTNSSGCTDTQSTSVTASAVIPCCITAANPKITGNLTLGTVPNSTKGNNEVTFGIVNTCAGNVTINHIDLDWDNAVGNSPQLTAWQYQGQPNVTFSPVTNPALSGILPLSIFNLLNVPFTTYSLPTSNNALNPLTVGYVFTKALVKTTGGTNTGDTISTFYSYTVGGLGGSGTCIVRVLADPNSPGITLCDPTIDPNCPGF